MVPPTRVVSGSARSPKAHETSCSSATPTGMLSYCSPAVWTSLGYRPEDLEGTNERDLIHPVDLATRDGLIARLLETDVAAATRRAADPQQERRVALVRDDRHELPPEPGRPRHRHQRAGHHRPQGCGRRAHRAHAARPAHRAPEPLAPHGSPVDRAGPHRAGERHDRGVVLRPRRVQGRERLGGARRRRPGVDRGRAPLQASAARSRHHRPDRWRRVRRRVRRPQRRRGCRSPRAREFATSSNDPSRSTTSKRRCR